MSENPVGDGKCTESNAGGGDRRAIATDAAPAAIGPYSQALLVGETLYCSGQIAIDPESGEFLDKEFDVQVKQVFRNLGAILQAAGMSFQDVVKVTIYLSDMSDFAELNEIYADHFDEPYPARATLEAGGLPKDAQVEMDLVAVRRP
jgi:2-iminobutanoate/2-iminopropanoate deaminase